MFKTVFGVGHLKALTPTAAHLIETVVIYCELQRSIFVFRRFASSTVCKLKPLFYLCRVLFQPSPGDISIVKKMYKCDEGGGGATGRASNSKQAGYTHTQVINNGDIGHVKMIYFCGLNCTLPFGYLPNTFCFISPTNSLISATSLFPCSNNCFFPNILLNFSMHCFITLI